MSDAPVILCPGQGAQALGMGRAWFDASPDAARTFGAADEQLGDRFGAPLSSICFDGPPEQLNRTEIAQPALFVAAVASFQALFNASDPGDLAATAGLSLGEYTALHLAGAISFHDALELVALRGRAMQDAADASSGSMVALVGADEAQAIELCDRAREDGVLVPANLNATGQVVVSGSSEACARAMTIAGEMNLRAAALEVAGAFHSPLMAPAAERLGEALAKTAIATPQCQVMSNVTGLPHVSDGEEVADMIRQRLVEQLTSPVRWCDDCLWLASHVVGQWHELAPGKVLSGLMRRINRDTKVTSHDAPEN